MMNEEWRPVVGYEAYYEVSSAGRVRSTDVVIERGNGTKYTRRGRVLKQNKCDGYPAVALHRDGHQRTRKVHRLMGEAFLGCGPGDHVRHLNDVRDDNRIDNLAPGTRSDNMFDMVRNGHHFNASKTHCARGHEFTKENTYPRRRGDSIGRVCKKCSNSARERCQK